MRIIPGHPILAKNLHSDGTRLVNENGQTVIFHGINLVDKGSLQPDGSFRFIPNWPEDLYERFAELGINLIRLGIIWAAVEPEPGQYDEKYLQYISEQLDLAERAGISVILDMHQDLYAQRFSDGAPDWAVLTDQPYEKTALWSDAYLSSPAVQESWDAFWSNQKMPETGKGLLDHYGETWAMLAKRFSDKPALLGYDILNEPAPGSEIQLMFGHLLMAFHGLLSDEEKEALGVKEAGVEDMAALFMDQETKLRMLEILSDKERYRLLGEMSREPVVRFEREVVEPFYEKVCSAIRQHDKERFLLRGNNYISNIGVPSGIRPIRVNGEADKKQIFAPHAYDLVVDTDAMVSPSDSRAESIFTRHRETQLALNLPAIATEWGAFAAYNSALTHGRFLLDLFNSWGWGHTYWCYTDDFFETPAARLLNKRS